MPLPAGSIRNRLFALIAAVALPSFGLAAWMFWAQVQREHRASRHFALGLAKSYAADVALANERARGLLERMAARQKVVDADRADCDSLFAIVDFFPQYPNLILYDWRGEAVCSGVPQGGDVKVARAAQALMSDYLRANGVRPGEQIVRRVAGRWVSISFLPVDHARGNPGTLALVQYVDLDVSSFPPGTIFTIADGRGIVIARSDGDQWIGRSIGETEVGRFSLGRSEGRVDARGVDGERRQYGFARIPGSGSTVYVGIRSGIAMAPVRSLVVRGALAGLVVLVVVALLAARISATIARPLRLLAHAAERTGEEGYGPRVPRGGPREVAVLADAFNRMVDSRAAVEAALVEARARQEGLSERLLGVQEEERIRIARELHDQLGQMLTALKMDIGGLLRDAPAGDPQQRAMAERTRRTLDEMIGSVQRITTELRPAMLDDFGLVAAIESEIRMFEERTGIECELSVPDEQLPLDPETETAIYRIFQEAMTNVARHSDATRVEIRLRVRSGEVLLEVRDDGRGILTTELRDRDALGIAGMRERARRIGAQLEIEGTEGRGTIVSLRAPAVEREDVVR